MDAGEGREARRTRTQATTSQKELKVFKTMNYHKNSFFQSLSFNKPRLRSEEDIDVITIS